MCVSMYTLTVNMSIDIWMYTCMYLCMYIDLSSTWSHSYARVCFHVFILDCRQIIEV